MAQGESISNGNSVVNNHSPQNGDTMGNKLWEHPAPDSTPMWRFKEDLNKKYKLQLQTYEDLHAWSIRNINTFWEEVWHVTGIKASQPYEKVYPHS